MGYDVTFHPIREEEIMNWYIRPVLEGIGANDSLRALAAEVVSDKDFIDDWVELVEEGRNYDRVIPFDCCHGMAIAQIQGLVRTFYYIRGGVFSLLLDKTFYRSCCRSWQEIIGNEIKRPVWNCIRENYCSGAYISEEGVRKLYAAINSNDRVVREDLLSVFGEENLPVFVKALTESLKLGAGLLEATEIVEPNPVDLRETTCMTNLMNCDFDGVAVYRKIAMAQIENLMNE